LSDSHNMSAFSFDAAGGESTGLEIARRKMPAAANDEQLRLAVEASGIATYHWSIETDDIIWSPNASEVLGGDPRGFSSGRSFATFLDTDNFTSRYDTVMRNSLSDDGAGVAFQIEYKFRPEGRLGRGSVWLEDHGRWFGGGDGRPVEVLGTVRRIDDRHMRDQHLSFLGNCDPLTGMMNRGRMMEALGGAMSVAGRDGTHCAFLIAAINNLPVVNDAYGFEIADEVIINMGRRLRQVVRTGDAIARYSGSKFGLILNSCAEDDLAIAAERFLSVARESVIETECGPVWALLSIGALVLPKHASDPNMAVARAEEALTEARKLPSDGFVIYKPSQQRLSERSLNAHSATEIVRCLREERFRLAFQPVVSASDSKPAFHEALLRLTDQAGEIVAAGHLIPVAEKLGLVRLIDRAVVQMTVAALNKFPDAKLSLNISGTTATDPRWYPQIIEILASNRNVTNRLIVEITETVALGDLSETIRFVEQLRELGCGVAIDDFGAGYTSFRNLRGMPVDILKLDGTFCSNLAGDPDNQYFVRSLIDLAHNFNMRAVAEWVETEADAALLRQWGIDLMQGHLFGEAQLDPPWTAADAHGFGSKEAIPFILPSEESWIDGGEESHENVNFNQPPVTAGEESVASASFLAPDDGETTAVLAQDDETAAAEAFALTDIVPEDGAAPEVADITGVSKPASEPASAGIPVTGEPQEISKAPETAGLITSEEAEPFANIGIEAEVASETPAPADSVAVFEESLSAQLDKLRSAIAALDKAFYQPAQDEPPSEPSFADLVSDTVLSKTG
jgi:diguanylate cyclase (GGDEF)-like protein